MLSQASLQHAIAWDNLQLQSTRLYLPGTGTTDMLAHWFYGVWSSCMLDKYFINWTTLPDLIFFNTLSFIFNTLEKTHSLVLQKPTFTSRAFFAF